LGAHGATPYLEGIPEMNRLLASLRIWQNHAAALMRADFRPAFTKLQDDPCHVTDAVQRAQVAHPPSFHSTTRRRG